MTKRDKKKPSKPRQPADDRRKRFPSEYVKDLNGQKAAIRVGYAEKSAKVTASRLLTDANVRAEIDRLIAKATAAAEITVERTLKEIGRLAYGDARCLFDAEGNLLPVHQLSDDAAALLASVETETLYAGKGKEKFSIGFTRKVKTWSKVKALDQCMSYLGMHKTVKPGEADVLNLSISLSDKGNVP